MIVLGSSCPMWASQENINQTITTIVTITSGIKKSCRMKLPVGASTGGSERLGGSSSAGGRGESTADIKSVSGGPNFSVGGGRGASTGLGLLYCILLLRQTLTAGRLPARRTE